MTLPCKPIAGFWITVALLVALVAYPLSFGPACWVFSHAPKSIALWEAADLFYSPILRAWWQNDQGTIGNAIVWYANLGVDGGLTVAKMLDGSLCLINRPV